MVGLFYFISYAALVKRLYNHLSGTERIGAYDVMLCDLWEMVRVARRRTHLYDQISCQGVAAISGLFEAGARQQCIPMC